MFVSQERGASRKPFQKPNILRRKSKVVRLSSQRSDESSDIMSAWSATSELEPSAVELQADASSHDQLPVYSVHFNELCGKNKADSIHTLEINNDNVNIYAHDTPVDSNDASSVQNALNVESFLNNETPAAHNNFTTEGTISETKTETKPKWCLDFMNEESKDTVTTNYYDGSQISNIYIDKSLDNTDTEAVPLAVVSLLHHQTNTSQEITNVPAQKPSYNCTNRTEKFKCDFQDCKKEFWTEARLQKHNSSHYNEKPKPPTIFECPVKKTDEEGIETKCGRTFLVRNQLMKHLNEEHLPEEALYRCGSCGRRFFWAGGARAHQTNGCSRAFRCGWAGCDRVFPQLCRLREHVRAHTGARPYPCLYPNCGWAFRSASKLVRHERRHTGERRHTCTLCGRAFLRSEHLREHGARHHAPRREQLPCSQEGCEQTFTSSSGLYMHLKRVHKKNDGKPHTAKRPPKNNKLKKDPYVDFLKNILVGIETATSATCETALPAVDTEITETIQVAEGDAIELTSGSVEVTEMRCARTHCTWPLQRPLQDYVLEDDTQVEQSESSESNIYSVRSDLFLHGNVLINEDSEFIIRAETGGESTAEVDGDAGEGARGAGQLDALGLIDSHPTIDLMQEELMYSDAVDESSFRVFLLNGEELS